MFYKHNYVDNIIDGITSGFVVTNSTNHNIVSLSCPTCVPWCGDIQQVNETSLGDIYYSNPFRQIARLSVQN